jgi:uncharacterized protein YceH (UPF0502 family)
MAIVLAGLLLVAIAPKGFADASTRLSSLESEILNQRMRLDRLESQLSTGSRTAMPIAPRATTPRGTSQTPSFDRLATLAVELKQDLRDLQAEVKDLRQRLTQLEGRS